MNVLGISAWDGPSAACLLRDGRIVAVAREDAFSRRSGDAAFPRQAIDYCLRAGKIGPTALSAAGLSGQERYPGDPDSAPRLLRKLGLGKGVDALGFVARELDPAVPVRAVTRALAVATGAFRGSPFEEAAVLLVDAAGVTLGRAGREGFRSLAEEGPVSDPEDVLRVLDAVRRAADCPDVVIGGALASTRSVLEAARSTDGETWIASAAEGGASALGAALESARGSADGGASRAPGGPGRALGPGYNAHQVRTFLRSRDLRPDELPRDDVAPTAARLLAEGKKVAWFAGRVGLGPEALASRAVLSLTGGPEDVRAVSAAHASDLFDLGSAPRSPLALGRPRDGSGESTVILRVDPDAHRPLHAVLDALRAAGKPPVVVVRPLARPGEPAACTPRDAFETFQACGADALMMERYLILAG